ncbi:MAG: response regulator [Leptolyngbyaceae bacterium]|nr:response regulator [Leptolyngbyaceae bacterium]
MHETALLTGVKILIVEAYADVAYLYQMMLELEGAKVTTTNRAHLAWAILEVEKFDVLITEFALPGETGLSLLQKLRAREADYGGYTPAIAITGRFSHVAKDQLVQKLRSAGFQAFLPKPIPVEELVGAVMHLTQSQADSHPTLSQEKLGEDGA